MTLETGTRSSHSLLPTIVGEVAVVVVFALILLKTTAQATGKRFMGCAFLLAITYVTEGLIVQVCLASGRPHWAAAAASLLWVQLLSASELLLVSRVDASGLPRHGAPNNGSLTAAASAIGLLWNMRRIGTRWQVKNVPSSASQQGQSRITFIIKRVVVTLVAYLFVDVVVSMPPPEPKLTSPEKATLFSLNTLSTEDVIFRIIMTISYWITTGTLNLFMNNTGAIFSVLLGLSKPVDCPPLYGSFLDAFTVRRFWGVTWHQMFRSFLTGHADLIVDNMLPFISRRSLISRYLRLSIAFFISGVIHHRGDQLMGVPDAQNGAIIFFLLQVAAIMMEDAIAPITSAVLPSSLRRVLGLAWFLTFLSWSSPIWIYTTTRLGIDAAALLPVRILGPWINVASQ